MTGGGGRVGNALVDHPDVAMITFTGSPDVGWGIRERAPRKKVGLELGNNAPVIIEADGDWKAAAAKIKVAGFSHAGQSCISTQRVYVHAVVARRVRRGAGGRTWASLRSATRWTTTPTCRRSSAPATPSG